MRGQGANRKGSHAAPPALVIPPNDERVRTREAFLQRIGDAHPQDAIGQAIPYGVYTLDTNQGYVCVGN